jgi:ribosomal protein L24E
MDDKVHEGVMYMKEKKTILIQCDNQGTISLSKNPMQHVWTKHIDFQDHFQHHFAW